MNSPGVRRQGMFGRTPSSACIQDYIAIALMDEQRKRLPVQVELPKSWLCHSRFRVLTPAIANHDA